MKKYIALLILFCFAKINFAQLDPFIPFYYTQVFHNDVQLKYPWLGGINSPQLQPVDLNNDGIEDLVIFDKEGDRIYTFTNSGTDYLYEPKFESLIPKINGWFVFRKISCDNIPDFITDNKNGSSNIYKGAYNANNELTFSLFQNELYYSGNGGIPINLYTSIIDRPAIVDVNGDGDLDFLAFSTTATRILYYENQEIEQNISCDTIIYNLVDRCWGNISESGLSVPLTLRDTCTEKPPLREIQLHAGSCMEAFDIDANGRMDLLLGDVILQNLNYLKNSGTASYASIIEQDTAFPSYNVPVSINSFACAVIMDIDHDSKKDMIVTPFERNGGENIQNIFFYKNISNTNALDLRLQNKNLFVGDMIDVGSGSIPRFFDYNNDGLTDIVIGTDNRKIGNEDADFSLYLYENIGKPDYPYFKLKDTDYLGLKANGLNTASAASYFVDIDNDGDKDAFVGREDGRIMYFANNSIGNVANFQFVSLLKDNGNTDIDIGQNAFPNFVDIDRNGTFDLIIGERSGNINFYRNIGTSSSPNFQLITDSLGKIKIGINVFAPGFSAPEINDFNNDGKWDLLLGTIAGEQLFYSNIEDSMDLKWTAQPTKLLQTNETSRTTFCSADISGDGRLEILKGNYAGGLSIFSQNPPPFQPVGILQNSIKNLQFTVFPNPAKRQIRIDLPEMVLNNLMTITIIDVKGSVLRKLNFEPQKPIDVSALEKGIYFIEIGNATERGIKKLIIQ